MGSLISHRHNKVYRLTFQSFKIITDVFYFDFLAETVTIKIKFIKYRFYPLRPKFFLQQFFKLSPVSLFFEQE